jgi:hypothetical protein
VIAFEAGFLYCISAAAHKWAFRNSNVMNVALESFVADHLFQQLKKKPELVQKREIPKMKS